MTVVSGAGTEFVTTQDGKIFVDLDSVIGVGQNTYDLACERTIEEARLAASFTELFRKFKRDCEAQIAAEFGHLHPDPWADDPLNDPTHVRHIDPNVHNTTIPLLGEADPELERLLAEEEEIERRAQVYKCTQGQHSFNASEFTCDGCGIDIDDVG